MWGRRKPQNAEETWHCRVCGTEHVGMPTDYGWMLPDEVWALGDEARKAHLEWSTDVCYYEGRWFLRGVLEVPFRFATGRWGWGCWAEVRQSDVERLWELGDEDGSDEPAKAGQLACAIPGHPDSVGLPVWVQFGPADKRPLLHFPTDCQHPLAAAQRTGIDESAYHDILDLISPGKSV